MLLICTGKNINCFEKTKGKQKGSGLEKVEKNLILFFDIIIKTKG